MNLFKWLGTIAIGIVIVVAFLIVRKHGLRREISLSEHVALSKQTFLKFAVASTVANLLFFVFVIEWMIPYFELSKPFFYAFWAGLACHLVATWTPRRGSDLMSKVHDNFAYTMALLMPATLFLLVLAPSIPVLVKFVAIMAAVLEVCLVILFYVKKSLQKDYFTYQAIYIAAYYVAMLLPAFVA